MGMPAVGISRRYGLLSNYFNLLFFWRLFTAITFGSVTFLPTALASQVMQSPLFVHFDPNFLTEWTITLTFCVFMVHDHSSAAIEGQMKCCRLCFAWECVSDVLCCVCSMVFIFCELWINCRSVENLVTWTYCLLTANNTWTTNKTAACHSVSLNSLGRFPC